MAAACLAGYLCASWRWWRAWPRLPKAVKPNFVDRATITFNVLEGKCYHSFTCDTIKDSDGLFILSEEAAIACGRKRCKKCKPFASASRL